MSRPGAGGGHRPPGSPGYAGMDVHLPGALGLGPGLAMVSLGANGGLALGMGWIGARLGFEYLVLAHLVAHLITVGAG